jgi:hypothetical protein
LASNFCVTLNFSSAHYQQDKSQIKNLKSLELFLPNDFCNGLKIYIKLSMKDFAIKKKGDQNDRPF